MELEGEINIEQEMDAKEQQQTKQETTTTTNAMTNAVDSTSSVDSWSAHDSTLLDLFDQASGSYDAAHDVKSEGESARKKQRTSKEQSREAIYANYPPKPPSSLPNSSTAVPVQPAQSSSNSKPSQHTPTASTSRPNSTSNIRTSPNPNYKGSNYRPDFVHPQSATTSTSPIIHTLERTIGTPTGNKQIAALVKQRVQSGRATGSPQAAAAPDNHSPSPAVGISSSLPGPLPQQWAPPSFPHAPHGAPPPPPMLPMHMMPGGGSMPPPPGLPPTHEAMMEDASLTNLLLSWYYAGYYTGQHQARKAMQTQNATTNDARVILATENGLAGAKRKLQQ